MAKLLTLVAILAVLTLARGESTVFDGNPIIEETMVHIRETHEQLGWAFGCCPIIVHPPFYEKNVSTRIRPVSGYRGDVSVIVDYGKCSVEDRGYMYRVYWGDGTAETGESPFLGPFQLLHSYDSANNGASYRVTVVYCSNPPRYALPCCASYSRVIDVGYDP